MVQCLKISISLPISKILLSRLQRHTEIYEASSLKVHLHTYLKEFLENNGYYLSKSNAPFHIPYILIPISFRLDFHFFSDLELDRIHLSPFIHLLWLNTASHKKGTTSRVANSEFQIFCYWVMGPYEETPMTPKILVQAALGGPNGPLLVPK